jgi:hypothetical protein
MIAVRQGFRGLTGQWQEARTIQVKRSLVRAELGTTHGIHPIIVFQVLMNGFKATLDCNSGNARPFFDFDHFTHLPQECRPKYL